MVHQDMTNQVVGFDINRAFGEVHDFQSSYPLNLLSKLLEIDSGLEFLLYSAQKRKRLNMLKESLGHPELRFQGYHSIKRLIQDRKLNIFHSNSEFCPDSKKIRKVLSVTNIGEPISDNIDEDTDSKPKWINSLKKFDRIICPSKALAKYLVDFLPDRAPDISVIRPGPNINTDIPIQDINSVMQKFGIKGDYFLYVGKLIPGKGIPLLIDAYIKYWGRSEAVPAMVFVSEQEKQVSAELLGNTALIESKGKFIITGEVSPDELAVLYASARILFHPSPSDLYSQQIIEAMKMGTPVICSEDGFGTEIDHYAVRFVVSHEIDDVCAAIEAIEGNPDYRNKLIEGGKKFAAKYSWDNAAKEVLEIYSELLNR
ncbi:MAG: glycosyltransferase [candidate division Zixibacteria bacterium]|nr:glycosyltransferase [candidate division Zixibacteria bacterium]